MKFEFDRLITTEFEVVVQGLKWDTDLLADYMSRGRRRGEFVGLYEGSAKQDRDVSFPFPKFPLAILGETVFHVWIRFSSGDVAYIPVPAYEGYSTFESAFYWRKLKVNLQGLPKALPLTEFKIQSHIACMPLPESMARAPVDRCESGECQFESHISGWAPGTVTLTLDEVVVDVFGTYTVSESGCWSMIGRVPPLHPFSLQSESVNSEFLAGNRVEVKTSTELRQWNFSVRSYALTGKKGPVVWALRESVLRIFFNRKDSPEEYLESARYTDDRKGLILNFAKDEGNKIKVKHGGGRIQGVYSATCHSAIEDGDFLLVNRWQSVDLFSEDFVPFLKDQKLFLTVQLMAKDAEDVDLFFGQPKRTLRVSTDRNGYLKLMSGKNENTPEYQRSCFSLQFFDDDKKPLPFGFVRLFGNGNLPAIARCDANGRFEIILERWNRALNVSGDGVASFTSRVTRGRSDIVPDISVDNGR